MAQLAKWSDLYEAFMAESEPNKLKERLGPLEGAIYERLQQLDGTRDDHEERLAIRIATDNLLEIKTHKLGFPPVK